MVDILIDTFYDTLRLLPFLFIAFLIIEFIEHKISTKNKDTIAKSGKFGPLIGSILGIFPQCGFSVMATNLYVTRILSLGTLIAIYLSTSDEMLPILLSQKVDILIIINILIVKVIIGMIAGFLIDFILRNRKKSINYEICDEEHCHCEKNILISALRHTLNITIFIFIASFILNYLIEFTGLNNSKSLIINNKLLTPFLTSIIGLIPNCASSVMITTLYTNGIISFSSLISGLLTGSGVALLVLFKSNKNIKENLLILFLVYMIGVISGVIIEFLNYIL